MQQIVRKVLANVIDNLHRQPVATVFHSHEQAEDAEVRVQTVPDEVNGREKLRQALQSQVLALDGH